ncbi:hypothetical protein [Salipiger abyssi]|uniref:Uncharacterized protein n=1 Tax=Salipiger abyssi TaxID=1250539 RepID=A0A1P8UWF3_9RHOB|nr:hypothetical protein [Salipiger abyssi]APZ53710.1 hypothetical protein Ga0080574_TMP3376 [Salipiger abyssi]
MSNQITDNTIDPFLDDVRAEVFRAARLFPAPNPTIAAMTEEIGEVAKSMLHMREGKHNDWWQVYSECVQLAAMAARCAVEGDPTIGAEPNAENCK